MCVFLLAFILCWKHCAIILPFFRAATCAGKTNWDGKEELSEILSINLQDEDVTIAIWGKSLKFMGQASSSFLEAVSEDRDWNCKRGLLFLAPRALSGVMTFCWAALYTSMCVTWQGVLWPGWELLQSLEPHSMDRSRAKITCPRDICRNNRSVKQLHNIIIFWRTLWGLRQITGAGQNRVSEIASGARQQRVSAVLEFLLKMWTSISQGSIPMASTIRN